MYNEQYKEIIENTVVIPYITLEHLENVLVSIGKTYGKEYVEENYKNEVNNEKNHWLFSFKAIKINKINRFSNFSSSVWTIVKENNRIIIMNS